MQRASVRIEQGVQALNAMILPGFACAWRLVFLAVMGSLPSTCAFAAEELRIYISADMEGVTGVASRTQNSPEGRDYERYRSQMTADVNAAIEGALAAGATEILVSDSHGGGENLKLHELHQSARVVRSFPRRLDMMHGINDSFDAAIFIGYHASAGTRDAVLAHTGNSNISAFRVNGVNLSEGGINAAIAGHFGVPVVMISGDRAAITELRSIVGEIESAEVKVGNGVLSATVQHPAVTRELIRESVQRGISRREELKSYRVQRPVTIDVSFYRTTDAEVASFFPGAVRTQANSVRFEVEDAIGMAKLFNGLMYLQTPDF